MKIGVAGVTSQDVGLLFHAIDKDKGGTVSYQELRDGLREKLNPTGLRYEGFEYACEMLGKYTYQKSELLYLKYIFFHFNVNVKLF